MAFWVVFEPGRGDVVPVHRKPPNVIMILKKYQIKYPNMFRTKYSNDLQRCSKKRREHLYESKYCTPGELLASFKLAVNDIARLNKMIFARSSGC